MKKTIIASLSIAILLFACKSSKDTATTSTTPVAPRALDCTAKSLTFAADIKPILETHCGKCHNTNNKAGYNFLTLESAKKAASDGHLLGTINHTKGFSKMPKFSGKLDQALIDKIECWIINGMKE